MTVSEDFPSYLEGISKRQAIVKAQDDRWAVCSVPLGVDFH